jgi:serine/threonine protein kinase
VDGSGKLAFVDYMNSKISARGNKTYTLCGVTDYLAPEQIAQTGHTEAVDLWSLGVLLYELCSDGVNPFHCDSEIQTYERIASLGTKAFPKAQPRNSTKGTGNSLDSLVEALLQPLPEKRLGMNGSDLSELKKHPYFSGINWNTLGSSSDKPSPLLEAAKAEQDAIINAPACEEDGVSQNGVPPEVVDNWNSSYVGSGWDEEIDISCPL